LLMSQEERVVGEPVQEFEGEIDHFEGA